MDWPNALSDPAQYGILSTVGEGCPAGEASVCAGLTFTGGFSFAANNAIYVEVLVPGQRTVTKMAWLNGATVSGNVDVGIYDEQGNRLVSSGSTAGAGTSAPQLVDITDVTIGPGVYFLAMAVDNATALVIGQSSAAVVLSRASGGFQQSSAFPLPATMTPGLPTFRIPVIVAGFQGTVL